MADPVQGRRLPVVDGSMSRPLEPGDYCGPLEGYAYDRPCVVFLKPNARDPDAPPRARQVHHVTSPPHTFIEEPDGSLTIHASIGDTAGLSSESDGWHGHLIKGQWHKLP